MRLDDTESSDGVASAGNSFTAEKNAYMLYTNLGAVFIKILAFWSLIPAGVSLMDTNTHLVVGHTCCNDALEGVFGWLQSKYWYKDILLERGCFNSLPIC